MKKTNNISCGFLITAYKQVELVEENIKRIQSYKHLNNSKIVVVTTSEVDVGFKKLESYNNVHIIENKEVPEYTDLGTLSIRIYNSIQKGLFLLKDYDVDVCLHLHSDTYWSFDKEKKLLNYLYEVYNNNYLFSGDLDIHCEESSPLPKGVHFHPEGLIFNVSECYKYGYGFTFDKIWDDSYGFKSHNYKSPEALLGQYAIFLLTKENIINKSKEIPKLYFDKVKVRNKRTYHGEFNDGLVNIKTKQG